MTSFAKIWLIRYFLITKDVIIINLKTMHRKKGKNLLKKKLYRKLYRYLHINGLFMTNHSHELKLFSYQIIFLL